MDITERYLKELSKKGNMVKKVICAIAIALILPSFVYANTQGHSASQIRTGTFGSGNYTFPNSVFITTRLGIATSTPVATLHMKGNLRVDNSTNQPVFFVNTNSNEVVIGGGYGKLTVGTIDPIFIIAGKAYATYVASMVGVKEEVVGVMPLEFSQEEGLFKAVIEFDSLEEGSDLWLFSRVINRDLSKMSVLLTPNAPALTWYSKDIQGNKLAFYSQGASEVSYRLTAPRFDYARWPNLLMGYNGGGLIVPAYGN